jgi:hypothetical protein
LQALRVADAAQEAAQRQSMLEAMLAAEGASAGLHAAEPGDDEDSHIDSAASRS